MSRRDYEELGNILLGDDEFDFTGETEAREDEEDATGLPLENERAERRKGRAKVLRQAMADGFNDLYDALAAFSPAELPPEGRGNNRARTLTRAAEVIRGLCAEKRELQATTSAKRDVPNDVNCLSPRGKRHRHGHSHLTVTPQLSPSPVAELRFPAQPEGYREQARKSPGGFKLDSLSAAAVPLDHLSSTLPSFAFLNHAALVAARTTCRSWRRLASHDLLWQPLSVARWRLRGAECVLEAWQQQQQQQQPLPPPADQIPLLLPLTAQEEAHLQGQASLQSSPRKQPHGPMVQETWQARLQQDEIAKQGLGTVRPSLPTAPAATSSGGGCSRSFFQSGRGGFSAGNMFALGSADNDAAAAGAAAAAAAAAALAVKPAATASSYGRQKPKTSTSPSRGLLHEEREQGPRNQHLNMDMWTAAASQLLRAWGTVSPLAMAPTANLVSLQSLDPYSGAAPPQQLFRPIVPAPSPFQVGLLGPTLTGAQMTGLRPLRPAPWREAAAAATSSPADGPRPATPAALALAQGRGERGDRGGNSGERCICSSASHTICPAGCCPSEVPSRRLAEAASAVNVPGAAALSAGKSRKSPSRSQKGGAFKLAPHGAAQAPAAGPLKAAAAAAAAANPPTVSQTSRSCCQGASSPTAALGALPLRDWMGVYAALHRQVAPPKGALADMPRAMLMGAACRHGAAVWVALWHRSNGATTRSLLAADGVTARACEVVELRIAVQNIGSESLVLPAQPFAVRRRVYDPSRNAIRRGKEGASDHEGSDPHTLDVPAFREASADSSGDRRFDSRVILRGSGSDVRRVCVRLSPENNNDSSDSEFLNLRPLHFATLAVFIAAPGLKTEAAFAAEAASLSVRVLVSERGESSASGSKPSPVDIPVHLRGSSLPLIQPPGVPLALAAATLSRCAQDETKD